MQGTVGSVRGAIGEAVDDGVARVGWARAGRERKRTEKERKGAGRGAGGGSRWLGVAGGGSVARDSEEKRGREQRLRE